MVSNDNFVWYDNLEFSAENSDRAKRSVSVKLQQKPSVLSRASEFCGRDSVSTFERKLFRSAVVDSFWRIIWPRI